MALAACPTNPTAPNPTSSTTPDLNDLFYLELKYDNLFSGMGGTVQKNGNIAQMNWRTRGRERQGYSFTYDFLDRMTAASYYDINDAGTATASSRYNEALTYADHRGNIATLQRQGAQLSGACWNYAQIDNLTYSYTAGTNKISSITDVASATYKAKGFNPGGGSGSYAYDVNGNLTTDPYKAMTVQYNHLNLPKKMTFGNDYIEITYDAAGTKLRKVAGNNAILTGGGGTEKSMNEKEGEEGKDDNAPETAASAGPPTNYYTQDYLGGIEYRDGTREAIYTAEGRVKYTSPTTTRYEYTIKDHLGNARISFCDLDNSGVVNVTNNPATNEVLQENHYYPFGLNTDGPWMNDAALDNKYQYNGKEFNDDFGLNLNDYGARWYDAAGVTWWSVDPLGSKYPSWSSYNYAVRNPMRFVDPDGMAVNDIIIKAKKGDETNYSQRTLTNLQSLTDDKLGFAADGQTVVIVEQGNGSKSEGTGLVRDLIGSSKDVVVTNDVTGVRNEKGDQIPESALNSNANTIANDPKAAADGTGTGSKVLYSPDTKAKFTTQDGKRETSSASMVLGHELIHADNNRTGTREASKKVDGKQKNQEEVKTVDRENKLRAENNQTLRSNGSN